MVFVLDTDLASILQRRSQPAYDRFQGRLHARPPAEVCVTIISFQEQVQGWMTVLNQARSSDRVVSAYTELKKILAYYCEAKVLLFEQSAQNRFVDLRKQRIRVATMDLRIASIALVTGSTLLSRNLRDFRRVPGLLVEDWTG